MRMFGLTLAALAYLSVPVTPVAQQPTGNAISAAQKDIGKVQAHIE